MDPRPRFSDRVKDIFVNNCFVSLYFENPRVRLLVALAFGLALNSVYVVFNVVYGIINRNPWFIAVAVYYTLLAAVRYTVLRVGKDGGSLYREFRAAAVCGGIVMAISLAMSAIMIYSAVSLRSPSYSALLISVLSVYSLYSLIRGVFGIKRSLKDGIPTHRAAYTVQLVSALTSVFNLRLATVLQSRAEDRELTLVIAASVSASVFALGAFLCRYGALGMQKSKEQ